MPALLTDADIAAELRRLKDESEGFQHRQALLAEEQARHASDLRALAERLDPGGQDGRTGNAAMVGPRLPHV
jgi:hypothetical protein